MSSPVSELMVQESVCTDELFKSVSENFEVSSQDSNKFNISTSSYSDDVIGRLLNQMVQILPPEERNVFGSTEDKNLEEIIQEANDLIRATTPLYSSSESCGRSVNKSSSALSKKSKTTERINEKDCSLAIDSSQDKSDNESIFSSLESILVKENASNTTPLNQDISPCRHENAAESKTHYHTSFDGEEIFEENINKLLFSNVSRDKNKTILENINNIMEDNSSKVEKQELKDLLSENMNGAGDNDTRERNVDSNIVKTPSPSTVGKKSEESGLDFAKQKHIAEIQELKIEHNKEISKLTEQINSLNNKVYEFQKHSKIDKNPDLKSQQFEQYENEIKNQEQLIAGYEKENKKLCREIITLKTTETALLKRADQFATRSQKADPENLQKRLAQESWKQKETKFVEEKQKLQNELQGMVSKSSTEVLEEQLKDAQETVVKLQIELATYKSKNKELEGTCERLRSETHRLQGELGRCHCDRVVGRRDRYSFLASSNVGSQIQELKNVISRKDLEIAQMSTTISILKGELSNRDTPQLQESLAAERQMTRDVGKERDNLLRDNLDLKRQVRELESIVKRRQKSDLCFPALTGNDMQANTRLQELEKELSSRQDALSALHNQFLEMQKKYEDHIQELENRLKESKGELQTLKSNQKKEELNIVKQNSKKLKQGPVSVKEETHLLATIRGLRQEVATREKEISKLNKEVEEVRLTNRKLQKEREKQLNSMPPKVLHIKEKANLRRMERPNSVVSSNLSSTSPNNNSEINPILVSELQESNSLLKSKTKSLQEEVKRLEQDLINMHNKRVHDLNVQQSEHEVEVGRLREERAALLSQSSAAELQGQIYTQQMVINHLKSRLKQMEELKKEVTLLRAERDHLEESLAGVNKKMCFLQNAQSPESIQYKTLLAKLETLEKNQEIREQKLNAVRELLSHSTQGQGGGHCRGSCRDKLLDKNRQICYYRAQMDRILEALLEIRRTK